MIDLTVERFPFVLALLVPGFVWTRVHRYLQVGRPPRHESWLDVFVLSSMNFALWSWCIPGHWLKTMSVLRAGDPLPLAEVLVWPLLALVSPTCLGVLSGIATRKGWIRFAAARRLGFRIDPPIDTAWTFAFRGPGRPTDLWVRVALKDGATIEGRFSAGSLSSPRSRDRDLFLEDVYLPSPHGRAVRAVDSAGVWIAGTEIQAIEFRRVRLAPKEDRDVR